jgi:hypothetical protein
MLRSSFCLKVCFFSGLDSGVFMIEVVLAFLGLFKLQVLSGNLLAGKAADHSVVKNICPAIFFLVSCPGGKP